MSKTISVMMLAARQTVYKLAGICCALAACEGAAFFLTLRRQPADAYPSLDQLIQSSHVGWISAACFLVLAAALCLVGCEFFGSRTRYTLWRLRVSERTATLLFSGINLFCLLIFWAVQTLTALALCKLFTAEGAGRFANHQTVFLAFYRSGFLHSLLPLNAFSRLARNVLLAASLSLAAACFSYRQRRGERPLAAAVLAGMTAVTFAQPMGSWESDVLISLMALAVTAPSAWRLWKGDEDEA